MLLLLRDVLKCPNGTENRIWIIPIGFGGLGCHILDRHHFASDFWWRFYLVDADGLLILLCAVPAHAYSAQKPNHIMRPKPLPWRVLCRVLVLVLLHRANGKDPVWVRKSP